MEKWNRIAMYPGAMTVAIPRVIWGAMIILLISLVARLILLGADLNNPLTGCRRFCLTWMFRILVRLLALFSFFQWCSHTELDVSEVDYSEYLGPNWKAEL